MTLHLTWMPAEAPYMPIVTAGILALLEQHDVPASACWIEREPGDPVLNVDTTRGPADFAELLLGTPWPDLEAMPWPEGRYKQGLKPTLKDQPDPADAYRALVRGAAPPEAELLRAILTDGVVDDGGIPARSRLLRGVKADLSSVGKPPKRLKAADLAAELEHGPAFLQGSSGLGLGLVPEVQTFGGTTGPDASTVGAYSPLLYLLLWRGIIALPPAPVRRGWQRVVGGPLVSAPDVLAWPRWRIPCDLSALRSLLVLDAIHRDEPERAFLARRGVDAVYRAHAVQLNTTVAVFRWGHRVAG